jgi:hypothetical protein
LDVWVLLLDRDATFCLSLNRKDVKKDHFPEGALTIGRAPVSFGWSGGESALS